MQLIIPQFLQFLLLIINDANFEKEKQKKTPSF